MFQSSINNDIFKSQLPTKIATNERSIIKKEEAEIEFRRKKKKNEEIEIHLFTSAGLLVVRSISIVNERC